MAFKVNTTAINTNTAASCLDDVKRGAFVRTESGYRNIIGEGDTYTAESDRYHLYVSLACPWACGTLQMLFLKGLEGSISHSIVHPTWQRTRPDDEKDKHCGWVFRKPNDPPLANTDGCGELKCDDALIHDTVNGCSSIRGLYDLVGDKIGRFTTPVLWDKETKTIVNNESREILRMFNDKFNNFAKHPDFDLFPTEYEESTKELDAWIYPNINNGVYRCGFATEQAAYDTAFNCVFDSLDRAEDILSKQRFICGDRFSFMDLRLFATLIRFDEVYVVYFKTNKKCIREYPNLFNYCKDVFQIPGVGQHINMQHIKTHYFTAHPKLNPYAIVPGGQIVDYTTEHDRKRFNTDKSEPPTKKAKI